jgi:hypothetical protein
MAQTSFSLLSLIIGEVRLEPEKIRGGGGPYFPHLFINLEILMKPFIPMLNADVYQPGTKVYHTLVQLFGEMSIHDQKGQQIQIAEFSSKPLLRLSNEESTNVQFSVPLDYARVNFIERLRAGDANLSFHFTALLAKHPGTPTVKQRGSVNESIEALRSTGFDLYVQIPQSHWAKVVLPELGYGQINLVEIPTPKQAVPEVFAKALYEFDQAQRYLTQGDFDKVVSHCRNCLDLIPKVVKLKFEPEAKPSYPDRVKKLLKEHLPVPLSDGKREAIEKMLTSLWSLTSISHHQNSHSSGYFNRADADFVITMTASLLSYVGRLLSSD